MTALEAWNLGLAIFGVLLSIAGFMITLWQLRKTRGAIVAAKLATDEAIRSLASRITISDLSDLRGGIRGVQSSLRGQRYETALIGMQSTIEQLAALRHRNGFESDERHTEIQVMVTQLAKLRFRLEQRVENHEISLSIPKANELLSKYAERLSAWSEEHRFAVQSAEDM